MNLPNECSNMEDIRFKIDVIDRQIIAAFGKRFEYVKAASKFKTSEASVKTPQRFEAMLKQRRIWAEAEGLNPDVVEKLHRDLVNYFIEEELKHWKSQS